MLLLLTSELLPVVESEYSPRRAAATAAAPAASSHGLRSDSNFFPFLKQNPAFDTIWRFSEVGTVADDAAFHARPTHIHLHLAGRVSIFAHLRRFAPTRRSPGSGAKRREHFLSELRWWKDAACALQPGAVAHLGGWDVSAGVCMIHFLTSDAVQMSRPKSFWARFDEPQWPRLKSSCHSARTQIFYQTSPSAFG